MMHVQPRLSPLKIYLIKAGDRNQMKSKQTNVVIFSLRVENNSNGSSNCSCTGFQGVLEVEKEQRRERWLEEKIKRNRHTALEISEDCSNNHLHIPKHMRMSQIVSAPPSEVTLPESGVFEQSSTPSNVSFHAQIDPFKIHKLENTKTLLQD